MRLTRAALRAEHAQHVDDETQDASVPHTDVHERVPLGEVSANTALDLEPTNAPTKKMAVKKGKAKGASKKGAKGMKAKTTQEEDADVVLENERHAAGSPASEVAADELADEASADTVQAPINDERPTAPPSRPVRMTRRQLAKQEEDFSKAVRSRSPPQPEPTEEETTAGAQELELPEPEGQAEEKVEEVAVAQAHVDISTIPVEEPAEGPREEPTVEPSVEPTMEPVQAPEPMAETPQAQEPLVVDTQEDIIQPQNVVQERTTEAEVVESASTVTEPSEPEAGTPAVEVTEPEPKVLASEKPGDEEITPATSLTPSRAISRSSSRSPSKTPMRLEESIGAIDALEEALENVGRSLPSFDQLAEEKSPRKAKYTKTAAPSRTPTKSTEGPSMAPKVSRNPSLAPKSLKPTGLSRASTVRAPPKERLGSGEVTDYLASKRRPISMTFAPPPPLAKSAKAPTTSTFQLPGELKAAELKARKEERLKRMAEAGPVKARPISMPPPPKSTKPPTTSNFQLPGELKAAELKARKEERLKRMAEGDTTAPRQVNLPPPPKSTKPPTVPNFQLPGEKFAAEQRARKEERLKREAEEAEAAKRTAFKARPAPKRTSIIAPVRQTAASQARLLSKENASGPSMQPPQCSSSVTGPQRSGIAQPRSISTSSSNRNSVVLGPAKLAPVDVAALRNKGREVFNRDKLEKESRERERREKEEAAKKARAEAAERGRIVSREWARKQREKREEAARRAREGVA
ncbi:hypothetical protein BU23DRAFT_591028 [Bimuria novae-zelandiae CBS 107.79]|uniref:Uncharacterized protein n=1 Tax=Bimuria novae-zelandiae CBS 107.79 TaxID=1447943 RepID=A0A6A5V622_9PLEO|nr:hypothetical protein BU23DRAFT_591028 [Bimuria novae-zelandiae CBS 107.79]